MNVRLSFAAAACLAMCCVEPAFAAQFTENFTEPLKADGSLTGWTLPSTGFSVHAGYLAYDTTPAKQFAVWSGPPVGTNITYTATITPSDAPGAEWAVAGIGIYTDDQNYWHLALVQAPDTMQKTHTVELDEMYNGIWGAQGTAGTILSRTVAVPAFSWTSGVTYVFKITLTPTQIQGQIMQAGVVKFSCTYQLTAQAVSKGRPMVDDAGIKANFTALSASITP